MKNVREKVEATLRHIHNVNENREVLILKLIDKGDIELARLILQNGLGHDSSKFSSFQFKHIVLGVGTKEELQSAIKMHQISESHHPEFHYGIKNMPLQDVAEMVCDWKSRSSEFGMDIRQWIDQEATKRYEFSKDDSVYKQIVYFLDLLLEKPFS